MVTEHLRRALKLGDPLWFHRLTTASLSQLRLWTPWYNTCAWAAIRRSSGAYNKYRAAESNHSWSFYRLDGFQGLFHRFSIALIYLYCVIIVTKLTYNLSSVPFRASNEVLRLPFSPSVSRSQPLFSNKTNTVAGLLNHTNYKAQTNLFSTKSARWKQNRRPWSAKP